MELFHTAVCICSRETRRQLKKANWMFSLFKSPTLKILPSIDSNILCLFSYTLASTVKRVNELQPVDECVVEDNSCVKYKRPNGKPRHSPGHIPHKRQFKSSQAVQILPCTWASGSEVNTATCSSRRALLQTFHSHFDGWPAAFPKEKPKRQHNPGTI